MEMRRAVAAMKRNHGGKRNHRKERDLYSAEMNLAGEQPYAM
jgi:hypothetical protein